MAWGALGLALAMAGGASARNLPAVFPKKQLLIKTDEFIHTRTKRPGDGQRHRMGGRFGPRWVALSDDQKTFPEDRVPGTGIWRRRALTNTFWPAKNGEVLRMNNQFEFCAWAKSQWIDDVEFLDLGFRASKADCPHDLEYYVRRQHPRNSEWLIAEQGYPPHEVHNPFEGRPRDAMYGDVFEIKLKMDQQVGKEDGTVVWEDLPAGGTNEGGGQVNFCVRIVSDDILPVKIHRILLAANAENRDGSGRPERLGVLSHDNETVYPVQVPPGDTFRHLFGVSREMYDVFNKVIRVHVIVDYETPRGETMQRRASTWYWKGAY